MAQPLLDLSNVGTVFEGIGRCGGAKRVGTKGLDTDAYGLRVVHHHVAIHRIAGESLLDLSIGPADGTEERTFGVGSMP